jgi:hypothetical protein
MHPDCIIAQSSEFVREYQYRNHKISYNGNSTPQLPCKASRKNGITRAW